MKNATIDKPSTAAVTKPVIELKNIKHMPSLSEETDAYSATIYVDGKKFAEVSNHGHGGSDDYHSIDGGWDGLKALNDRIKATFPMITSKHFKDGLEPDLELICGDLLGDWMSAKHWKRKLTSSVLGIDEGKVWAWKAKPTPEMIKVIKEKNPKAHILNELPQLEALKLIRETEKADD
jgi:hypothetical protein